MPLTEQAKVAAKENLRQKLNELNADTISFWRNLFTGTEEFRKACGYSQGADDMLKKLVAAYDRKHATLMAPFDRGDFD